MLFGLHASWSVCGFCSGLCIQGYNTIVHSFFYFPPQANKHLGLFFFFLMMWTAADLNTTTLKLINLIFRGPYYTLFLLYAVMLTSEPINNPCTEISAGLVLNWCGNIHIHHCLYRYNRPNKQTAESWHVHSGPIMHSKEQLGVLMLINAEGKGFTFRSNRGWLLENKPGSNIFHLDLSMELMRTFQLWCLF